MLPVVVKALFVDMSESLISMSPNLVVAGSSLDPSSSSYQSKEQFTRLGLFLCVLLLGVEASLVVPHFKFQYRWQWLIPGVTCFHSYKHGFNSLTSLFVGFPPVLIEFLFIRESIRNNSSRSFEYWYRSYIVNKE